MSRIVLTFKNNEKEKKIEEFLDKKVSSTAYLKELVWEVMNNGTVSMPVKSQDVKKVENKKPRVGGFTKV